MIRKENLPKNIPYEILLINSTETFSNKPAYFNSPFEKIITAKTGITNQEGIIYELISLPERNRFNTDLSAYPITKFFYEDEFKYDEPITNPYPLLYSGRIAAIYTPIILLDISDKLSFI